MQKMKVISDIWTLMWSLISKLHSNTKKSYAIKVSLLQDSWTLLVILSPFRLFQMWFTSIVTQNHYEITLVHGKWTGGLCWVFLHNWLYNKNHHGLFQHWSQRSNLSREEILLHNFEEKNQISLDGNNIFLIIVVTVIYLPSFYVTSHFIPFISVILKHFYKKRKKKKSWEQDLCLIYLYIALIK